MYYPCSSALQSLFESGSRQICRLTFSPIYGASYVITESDVKSLTIDRYTTTAEEIQIGTCCAAEAEIVLSNIGYQYSNKVFEGSKVKIEIGTQDWTDPLATPSYITMGVFTVDVAPRLMEQTITLSALDNMARFDKIVDDTSILGQKMSSGTLFTKICANCGVTYSAPAGTFPNMNRLLPIPKDSENLTYRQLLIWICQLLGVCGYITYDGQFTYKWYTKKSEDTDGFAISKDVTYSIDIEEKDIIVTGFSATINDTEYKDSYGNDTYCIDLSSNQLLQGMSDTDITGSLDALAQYRRNFRYRPFTAHCVPMPFITPLDYVAVHNYGLEDIGEEIARESDDAIIDTETDGPLLADGLAFQPGDAVYSSMITNSTFTMNGGTQFQSKGKSTYSQGWASTGALTAEQSAIVEGIRQQLEETEAQLDEILRTRMQLNMSMYDTMGFYRTEEIEENGVRSWWRVNDHEGQSYTGNGKVIAEYSHNDPLLANSSIVFKQTASGLAWTDAYNGGSTVWKYGYNANGDAVFNTIVANHFASNTLTTNSIDSKAQYSGFKWDEATQSIITATGPISWINLENGSFEMGNTRFFGNFYMPSLSLSSNGELQITGKLVSGWNRDIYSYLGSNFWGLYDGGADAQHPAMSINPVTTSSNHGVSISSPFAECFGTSVQSGNICMLMREDGTEINFERSKSLGGGGAYIKLYSNDILHTNDYVYLGTKGYSDKFNGNYIELKQPTGTLDIHARQNNIRFTRGSGVNLSAYITSSGEFYGDFHQTSDKKAKKNIKKAKSKALDSIKDLSFYEYDMKEDSKHFDIGIMTDEAPAEIVSKNEEGYDGINLYSYITYVAKALQELNEKVEKLEKESDKK